MTETELARTIATAAHGARGQHRADGVTPYITHPTRVVELVREFVAMREAKPRSFAECDEMYAAAWLHDVVEDTRLTLLDLRRLGISARAVEIVDLLTKKNGNQPATPEYYQGIARDDDAIVVKCADRCANLESALDEVNATRGLRRWRRYVEKTYADVLPMYVTLPLLRAEIQDRLAAIEAALSTEVRDAT